MNAIANNIKQRLSLREPLQDALDIVAKLADELEMKKEVNLVEELEKVKSKFHACTDFERDFRDCKEFCVNEKEGELVIR